MAQCQRCTVEPATGRNRVKSKGRWRSLYLCKLCFKFYQSEGKTEDKR